jgi:hypothetical protein
VWFPATWAIAQEVNTTKIGAQRKRQIVVVYEWPTIHPQHGFASCNSLRKALYEWFAFDLESKPRS